MHLLAPVSSVLLLVACHGAPPASPSNAPAKEGTSGFAAVSWGDPIDEVHAGPRTIEGLPAMATFDRKGDGVSGVHLRVATAYPTMASCAEAWKTLRARFDARLGASQADNLAAYWTTKTAAITAACNPGDTGGAALSIDYVPPE